MSTLYIHVVLVLCRMVPSRPVYVPRLREALGYGQIDIVLEHVCVRVRGDRLDYNVQHIGDNKNENRDGNGNRNSDVRDFCEQEGNCSENAKKKIRIETNENESDVCVNGRRCEDNDKITFIIFNDNILLTPFLTMSDSAGVAVKMEFQNKIQYNTILYILNSAREKRNVNAVQISVKNVMVKSTFGNLVTCLKATELSEFTVLKNQNHNFSQVRYLSPIIGF